MLSSTLCGDLVLQQRGYGLVWPCLVIVDLLFVPLFREQALVDDVYLFDLGLGRIFEA